MPRRPPGGSCGPAQRAEADDPGAQQRGRRLVVEGVGQPVGEGLVDHGQLGVAAVVVPAGEARLEAEVLVAAEAEAARAVGAAQPGDADPLAHREPLGAGPAPVDPAHDLVAGHDVAAMGGQVALDHVQVGPAHAAGADPDPDLARSGLGIGPLAEHQRRAR